MWEIRLPDTDPSSLVTLTTLLLLNALVRLKFNAVLAVDALLADAPNAPEFLESPVSLRVEVLVLLLLLSFVELSVRVLVLLLSSVFVLVELSVLVLVLLLSTVLVLLLSFVELLVLVLELSLLSTLLSVLTRAVESPAAEALPTPLEVEGP